MSNLTGESDLYAFMSAMTKLPLGIVGAIDDAGIENFFFPHADRSKQIVSSAVM